MTVMRGKEAQGPTADHVLLGTQACKTLRRFKGTESERLVQPLSRGLG